MQSLTLAAAILFAFPLVAAQPDFTGAWKLNLAESDYKGAGDMRDPTGQVPPPESMLRVVTQKGNALKYRMERVLNGRKYEFEAELTIGGEGFSSDPAGALTAEWKGKSLVIHSVYNPMRARSERTEVWTLTEDGKKMVDEMVYRSPEGKEVKIRRVFDKQ
ncbi:MAG: hypothetical protein K2X35_09040 [Bryobacteraceae bacterium]|nr:hypothetical protein [Bryobacteraceae bacterium]